MVEYHQSLDKCKKKTTKLCIEVARVKVYNNENYTFIGLACFALFMSLVWTRIAYSIIWKH